MQRSYLYILATNNFQKSAIFRVFRLQSMWLNATFICRKHCLYSTIFILLKATITFHIFVLFFTCGNITRQCGVVIDNFCRLFGLTKYSNPSQNSRNIGCKRLQLSWRQTKTCIAFEIDRSIHCESKNTNDFFRS